MTLKVINSVSPLNEIMLLFKNMEIRHHLWGFVSPGISLQHETKHCSLFFTDRWYIEFFPLRDCVMSLCWIFITLSVWGQGHLLLDGRVWKSHTQVLCRSSVGGKTLCSYCWQKLCAGCLHVRKSLPAYNFPLPMLGLLRMFSFSPGAGTDLWFIITGTCLVSDMQVAFHKTLNQ